MDYSSIRVALDGPSGAGKSTIAKAVAAKTGLVYVDTGALYRTVGLYSIQNGVAHDDTAGIIATLEKIDIDLAYENGQQCVYLNGEAVGDRIRTEQASLYASAVSKIPEVRAFLLDMQKKIAKKGGVIMDGRDIGTVIIPDAEVKIFMSATPEERARRRFKEQKEMKEQLKSARAIADAAAECFGKTGEDLLLALRTENERKSASADTSKESSIDRETLEKQLRAAVETARAETEDRLLASIRARGLRPTESALGVSSGNTLRRDTSQLSRAQRAEVARRAAKGERIKL
jgi:cytidylate kinase